MAAEEGHPILAWLSPAYGACVGLRGRLYDSGWLPVTRLPIPVLSVGNLTVGGTGKSPMVALVAGLLARGGRSPAILSRGYGGRSTAPATVVSAGDGPRVGADVAGDEPVMLAARLRGVGIVVARRRAEAGRLAIDRLGARCAVLDDGFQHRALARRLDLVLLDAVVPFGNGRLLPAGTLREPVSALARAGAIVITRFDRARPGGPGLAAIRQAASRHCPSAPIFHAVSRPTALIEASTGSGVPLERLARARVACFSGIARPGRFVEDLAALGATVVDSQPFPDHHAYGDAELAAIAARARQAGAELLITTEKDAARLGAQRLGAMGALVLRVETFVEEAGPFERLILEAAA